MKKLLTALALSASLLVPAATHADDAGVNDARFLSSIAIYKIYCSDKSLPKNISKEYDRLDFQWTRKVNREFAKELREGRTGIDQKLAQGMAGDLDDNLAKMPKGRAGKREFAKEPTFTGDQYNKATELANEISGLKAAISPIGAHDPKYLDWWCDGTKRLMNEYPLNVVKSSLPFITPQTEGE